MSKHENEVVRKILERAEFGLNKYGVSVERTDLTDREWLIHLQEELMDASVYVERIIHNMDVNDGNKVKKLADLNSLMVGVPVDLARQIINVAFE